MSTALQTRPTRCAAPNETLCVAIAARGVFRLQVDTMPSPLLTYHDATTIRLENAATARTALWHAPRLTRFGTKRTAASDAFARLSLSPRFIPVFARRQLQARQKELQWRVTVGPVKPPRSKRVRRGPSSATAAYEGNAGADDGGIVHVHHYHHHHHARLRQLKRERARATTPPLSPQDNSAVNALSMLAEASSL